MLASDLRQFLPPQCCVPDDISRCLQQGRHLFASHCESSLILAQAALDSACTLEHSALQAEALILLGQSQQVLQQTDVALASFQRALVLGKRLESCAIQSVACEGLALCYQNLRQNPKALQAWLNALELGLQSGEPVRYIQAYLGIGSLYFQHENYEQACYYQAQAVEWSQLQDDRDLQAKARLHLAATLIKMNDYSLAEQLLQQTENILLLPVRLSWQAEINHYLGLIQMARQDWPRAEHYFQAAHALNVTTASRWGQTQSLISLGQLSALKGDLQAAIVHLQDALQLAEQQADDHLRQQIHAELSALYEAQGDYVRATAHHIEFHQFYLQLLKQNTSDQLDALSSRRLKQAEIKLQLLRSELEVKQLMQQRSLEHERMQQLENAAFHDALTGAFNRHALDEQLPVLLQQARQDGSTLCLIMIDFDHFKQVNDGYSHQVGDEVLKTGIRLLLALTRETDLLARFGGEEFVLILPRKNAQLARRVAERMRQEIEQFDWAALAPGLAVTISLGCAQWHSGMGIDDLMAAADQALYQAKHAGRNQVCLAPVPPTGAAQ
ncbi:diguanylate cyclase [Chitinibacter sp. FCG-7]|uniref:diguanylate cyclase n=1 Tax=Chitinibacter mangrovi TaxID=3153927 RepID=A0AAU7F504_9NEIS